MPKAELDNGIRLHYQQVGHGSDVVMVDVAGSRMSRLVRTRVVIGRVAPWLDRSSSSRSRGFLGPQVEDIAEAVTQDIEADDQEEDGKAGKDCHPGCAGKIVPSLAQHHAPTGDAGGQADAQDITRIAIPRIGVGYGGLSWRKVRAIVETVFGDWPGTLIVYEEFVPGEADNPG